MLSTAIINEVLPLLPKRLSLEISEILKSLSQSPEEIRLRANRRASLTLWNKNLMLNSVTSSDEIRTTVQGICQNSVYAYKDSIAEGFVSLENGVRVGIAGKAFCENGRVSAVHDISSIVIRLPRKADLAAKALCSILSRNNRISSCLIYAASGEGKTTLLRSAAYILSGGVSPLRVCVVDTREELGAFLGGTGLCIDILKGYPKDIGCEIAARTLNSELIICDEIFGEKEAAALSGAVNCGIPILCSAHAASLDKLLTRQGIDLLHRRHVFDHYIKISRGKQDLEFNLKVDSWEDADHAIGD